MDATHHGMPFTRFPAACSMLVHAHANSQRRWPNAGPECQIVAQRPARSSCCPGQRVPRVAWKLKHRLLKCKSICNKMDEMAGRSTGPTQSCARIGKVDAMPTTTWLECGKDLNPDVACSAKRQVPVAAQRPDLFDCLDPGRQAWTRRFAAASETASLLLRTRYALQQNARLVIIIKRVCTRETSCGPALTQSSPWQGVGPARSLRGTCHQAAAGGSPSQARIAVPL